MCGEEQYNFSDWLNVDLTQIRIYWTISRIGNSRFSICCLTATHKGWITLPLVLERLFCFCVSLCLWESFKISAVFCDPVWKEIFPAQESLSSLAFKPIHYLTYIDLKEVVDLFLRSTQVDLRLEHYWFFLSRRLAMRKKDDRLRSTTWSQVKHIVNDLIDALGLLFKKN